MAEYKGKLLSGLFTRAKNVILSDNTNVNDRITPNTLSTPITIASGTYTFLSDGYLQVYAGPSTYAYATINGDGTGGLEVFMSGTNTYNVTAIYVRKGMSVTVNDKTGQESKITFFPLA